jgi:hypothetical protein
MVLLDFVLQIFVYFSSIYFALCMRQYFWRIVLNLRFKIDVVVIVI